MLGNPIFKYCQCTSMEINLSGLEFLVILRLGMIGDVGWFHRVPDSKIIHAYTNISNQTKSSTHTCLWCTLLNLAPSKSKSTIKKKNKNRLSQRFASECSHILNPPFTKRSTMMSTFSWLICSLFLKSGLHCLLLVKNPITKAE